MSELEIPTPEELIKRSRLRAQEEVAALKAQAEEQLRYLEATYQGLMEKVRKQIVADMLAGEKQTVLRTPFSTLPEREVFYDILRYRNHEVLSGIIVKPFIKKNHNISFESGCGWDEGGALPVWRFTCRWDF